MKVIQINTVCGYGSTGSIAVDIAKELEKYDVESKIIFGQHTTMYDEGYNLGFKIENKVHSALSRILGVQGFFSWFGTARMISFIKKFKPDIVHIHNLHGNYVCYPFLLRYLAKNKISVVYTLHDCWLYTGKCAHYVDVKCNKWQNGCSHCPKVKAYPPSLFFDASSLMHKIKKKSITIPDKAVVVGVSKWIANESRNSFLSKYNIVSIYNWIDMDVFYPTKNEEYLQKLGIQKDDYVLLGVCGKWSKAKGIDDWIALAEQLSKDVKIVLVGRLEKNYHLPENCIHVEYTEKRQELATLYTRAQVFLNLSEAESFGKTTAEALACGTPVIVYNTTACPELVGPQCGYVAEALTDVIEIIQSMYTGKIELNSKECIEYAKSNFDIKKNIYQYYLIYKELTEV